MVQIKKGRAITAADFFNFIFFVATVSGVMVSIFMNLVNRSFWVDEAALAYEFSKRSFWNMADGSFSNGQIAPLGWLYIEKMLEILFGNTEFVLRIGSIAGFVLTLLILYYLMKNCFQTAYPWAACAFYANMSFILQYSNTFKPYIWDGFFVLLVIALFYLYGCKKIRLWALIACWSILIWFSNPVCFFEGGLLAAASLDAFWKRDWKRAGSYVLAGGGYSV